MSVYILDETFTAGGDIPANTILKMDSSTGIVSVAGSNDKGVGITGQAFTYGSGATPNVSASTIGVQDCIIGAAVNYDDPLVSDGSGHAIPCPGTPGTWECIGYAREKVTTFGNGEVARVFLCRHVRFQEAAD